MGTAGVEDAGRALAGALARQPRALVAAVGEDGLFVAPPPSLPLSGHTVVEARAATDIVAPGEREQVIEAWEQALATGYGCAEVALPGADGPATMHVFDVRAEHGVYVMVLDAGDEPPPVGPVEAASTEGVAKVVRVRKDGVAVLQEIDASVTAVLGWRPDELVGRRSLDLIHPDDHELAITAWMDMLADRGMTTRARLRHQRADGGWTWMDISNTNRLDGTAGHVECDMVDVTDEVRAQEALRASEQLLRRLTESMSVGMFHIDRERRLLLTNPSLHAILGTGPDDDLATLAGRAVDPLTVDRAMDAVLGGADVDMELEVVRVGGDEVRHLMVSARALFDEQGVVVGAVGCVTDVTESARLRDELAHRATVDHLTGCANRLAVLDALDASLRLGLDVAVAFVDLDGFKRVNDEFGHAAGDTVLQAVAARLRSAVRTHDTVGRMGGDEFLLVCAGVTGEEGACELRHRVEESLRDPVACGGGQRLEVSASIGIAWAAADEHVDADTLVARADADMYARKGDAEDQAPGRNRRGWRPST